MYKYIRVILEYVLTNSFYLNNKYSFNTEINLKEKFGSPLESFRFSQ